MAETSDQKVLVIPCSGIGKVHGLIGREAAYRVTDEMASDSADTVCLALLVKGDADAVAKVRRSRCITIDGCPKACAEKNVQMAGGTVDHAVRVVDAFRNHRGAQPGSGSILTEDGWAIVGDIAVDVSDAVRSLCGTEE